MKVLENTSLIGRQSLFEYNKLDLTIKSNRFAIYVPSFNSFGKIPEAKLHTAIAECRNKLRQLAGGTSEHLLLGTYLSNNGDVVKEKIIKVNAFFSIIDSKTLQLLLDICLWIKDFLSQEKIAAEFDSDFVLI